jgi:tetratricopeptide (TPR) repeat protein
MAELLRAIRVFIASPGGLDNERHKFREVVEELNHQHAYGQGVVLIPLGWDLATLGVGRPQETINDLVRESDYLVLLLHDRWGRPPSADGRYSSGTEEEYNVARECLSDPNMRMRDIAVLFKGVEARQMSDPGEQLQKVLAFRSRLEEEHDLLYGTFDSLEEFASRLRGQLMMWIQGGEGPSEPRALPSPDDPPARGGEESAVDETVSDLLDRAAELEQEGRWTQAESLYASAVVGRTDPEALTRYIRFLRRQGRLQQAVAIGERLYEIAQQRGEPRYMVEALSNRAIVRRKESALGLSIQDLEDSIKIATDAGPDLLGDLAFLLDNMGLTLRKQGKFDEAVKFLREALAIKRELGDAESVAKTLNNLGAILRQQGDTEEAVALHREAIQTFEELGYQRGQAQTRANLGEIYVVQGEVDAARSEYAASLELNEGLQSPEGIGMNLWQLGRLELEVGKLDEAMAFARRAYEVAEQRTSRLEAVATPAQLMGNVALAKGETTRAIELLTSSATAYDRSGQKVGAAWTHMDLAAAYSKAGDPARARDELVRAEGFATGVKHSQLAKALDEVRSRVAADGDSATTSDAPAG